MAENAFTPYKGFTSTDYRLERERISDQQYMDMQKQRQDLFGVPLKSLEPTQRDKDTEQMQDAFSYLGMTPENSTRFARDLVGRDRYDSAASAGVLDFTPYAPLVYDLPQDIDDFKRARAEGNVGGQVLSGAMIGLDLLSPVPFALMARGAKKPLTNFAESLGKKFKGDTTPKIGAFSTMLEQSAKEPKVLANTKRMPPSMAMTDPKVVDEFGFYSEAERQAKMMQQNKGSGAQFQGMLLNKGVKKDEIEALGLDELFKNENVTKKEIIDTIELNKVQLIETQKTGKSFTDPNDPYLDDFDPETFTNIRNGEEGFNTADEVKEAYETGRYSEPTIEYDVQIRTYANSDETEPMKLYGKINTHMPTQYKILELQNLSDEGQDITDIYLTFRPNADVKDWRNSVEASTFADEKGFDTKDLISDDLAEIIQDRSAQTFEEATVRLRGATIAYGDYDPGSLAKWEGSTQDGGTNYKELLLRLPPKGDNRFGKNIDSANPRNYKKGKDFQYRTHFDEFNPLFHIRTKDRVTTDGKKVLYVEELQSDWGQRGAGQGFKLEGEKLAVAKKELADVSKELTDLKKGGVKLDGYEQETLYKLAYPNRPPIRIPFIEPKDFRAKHDFSPTKYYDTEGNVKDYEFDYSQSRMPEELRTMTYGQYMNFYETMGRLSKGELNERSIQLPAYRDTILDPQDSINRYYDDKDADFLFGQINQPGFNADGNKFMKDLSKKYLQKANAVQGGVPNAPFVTDRNKWTGLAIKRLIKLADEGGYDHIAFSPGKVQLDRWGKQSLVDYYDKIIPQVASKLPKSLGVTTEQITIPISDKKLQAYLSGNDNGTWTVSDQAGRVLDTLDLKNRYASYEDYQKYFQTKEDAQKFINTYNDERLDIQETFAINITPKMKETVRGGMPLFSTIGGMLGVGATMSNQDIGGLGSLPNDQT